MSKQSPRPNSTPFELAPNPDLPEDSPEVVEGEVAERDLQRIAETAGVNACPKCGVVPPGGNPTCPVCKEYLEGKKS